MVRFVADVPLRVKLIAAMLALVTMALVVIGVASAVVMRNSLLNRIDDQLRNFAQAIDTTAQQNIRLLLPRYVNFVVSQSSEPESTTILDPPYSSQNKSVNELPTMPTASQVTAQIGKPYNAKSRGTMARWRILVTQTSDGFYLVVGESLADVDSTVDDLVAAELVIGAGVLIVLAGIGVAIVQSSLQPLRDIERTAAAINARFT